MWNSSETQKVMKTQTDAFDDVQIQTSPDEIMSKTKWKWSRGGRNTIIVYSQRLCVQNALFIKARQIKTPIKNNSISTILATIKILHTTWFWEYE